MLWLSNLLLKLAKQVVNTSIIFITSITPESPSRPLDCSIAQFLLSFLGPFELWSLAFFNALSLWQFGLVCPWSQQWWQKCFVLGPLWDFGSDFPLALGFTTNWLRGFINTRWSVTFLYFSSFTFTTFVVATIGSLTFTNFISLDILAAELLSPLYPNLLLSEKGFWWASTSSSFLEETRSTLAFA